MIDYHQQKWVRLVPEDPAQSIDWEGLFITDEITKNMTDQKRAMNAQREPVLQTLVATASEKTAQGTQLQWLQQDRPLLHLDYAKLVAGFNIRHPDGGNEAATITSALLSCASANAL